MSCRQWFNNEENNNCAIIAAELGPMTLQNIGNLFSLTRMRICQIEKNAMKKIREIINP
jgi:DNA-directed RNA polymerase sigma subunit (sigma70/sigma32)